jgi:drug/metabolite transporter (DMT)-like permease
MESQDYTMLFLLAALWGASFFFIKVAVGEMSPVFLVFWRTLAAAAGLAIALPLARIPLSALRRYWKPGLVIAVTNAALPYTLISFGETHIDSSLAGILNATAPLWTALLGPLWAEAEGLRPRQYAGLALGFLGTVILARPTGSALSSSSLGVLAVVLATLSYAFATHFSKRHFQEAPALVPAFLQCAFGALLLAPLVPFALPSHTPSPLAIASVAWLGLGATGLAMVISFWLIKRIGASRSIVVTYLIPPFALVYGVVLLHEKVSAVVVAAMVLILAGVFLNTSHGRRVAPVAPDEAVMELEA